MTTALTEGKWILEYKNRSSRQLYYEECIALDVPVNELVYRSLCDVAGDFTAYQLVVPESQFIGRNGVRALLPVVKVNQMLTRLAIVGQGADDSFVLDLLPLLKEHERLHIIDLRDNPEITDVSCDMLAMLIKRNNAIITVRLSGTSMCEMVQRTLVRFSEENNKGATIFLTGDYVAFKQLFNHLDTDSSGAVSMLDLFEREGCRSLLDAIEKRFNVIDTTGDAKIQIDEFLEFLHPNFFAMKDRLAQLLKAPDSSEENVVENWAMIVEAARRSLVRCPSFHLARVFHKKLTLEEATSLIREAVVHEHKRSGSTPDEKALDPPNPELCKGLLDVEVLEAQSQNGDKRAQALLDMYTTIQCRSMHFAVESLFGRAEAQFWGQQQRLWSPIYNVRIPPSLARHIFAVFMQRVNEDIDTARQRFRDVHAPEVPIESLLATPIRSSVWSIKSDVIESALVQEGLALSTPVTFAEWFTLLNDRFDTSFGTRGETLTVFSPVAAPRK